MVNIFRLKSQWILALGCLTYIFINFIYLDKYPAVYGDESLYTEPVTNFLAIGKFRTNLYPPIGGFDQSNLIHGRIFNFVQALFLKIFGVNILAMRIQPFLAGLLTILLTYLMALELFSNKNIAIIAAVWLSLSHVFIFASHFARPDMTASLFTILSIYILLIAKKNNSDRLYFLSSLIAALNIDIHPPGNIAIFIVFGLLAQWFFSKEINKKNIFYAVLGTSVGLLWWCFWHILLDTNLYLKQRQFIQIFQQRPLINNPLFIIRSEFQRWYDFFWMGAYHRNIFLLILFLISNIYAFLKFRSKGSATVLIAIISGTIGFCIGAPNKTTWYVIYIYPFLILSSAAFLYDFHLSRSLWKRTAIWPVTLLLILFLTFECTEKLRFYHSDYNNFIKKVMKQIPEGSRILASDNLWIGLKDHGSFIAMHVIGHRTNMLHKKIQTDFYAGSFEDFFRRLSIQYIVADEEMLSWPHLKDTLHPYINTHCKLVTIIEDP
ncbi:MAG: hypothetical protein A2034_01500, partial [Elusimicrobia bacterium GWA2_38_7]